VDLSRVVNNSRIAENWVIQRGTAGQFAAGGWQESRTSIPAYGIVSVADAKTLDQLPEGDRVREAMIFHSTTQMFVTNAANNQTSDLIQWNNDQYRVIKVADYATRGFWWAIAGRIDSD